MISKKRKKTLVLGASLNAGRYSNICINDLVYNNYPVVGVGLRAGEVAGVPVMTGFPPLEGIHTITLYLGPKNQPQFYGYILGLKPKRIIFNPGTWNAELADMATELGINVESKCTLMMLSGGYY